MEDLWKVRLAPEQHRIIRTFIHYFGEDAMEMSPFIMEMLVIMSLVGEPEMVMTEEEWDLYDKYLEKWNIRKEVVKSGKHAYKPQLLYRLTTPFGGKKDKGERK